MKSSSSSSSSSASTTDDSLIDSLKFPCLFYAFQSLNFRPHYTTRTIPSLSSNPTQFTKPNQANFDLLSKLFCLALILLLIIASRIEGRLSEFESGTKEINLVDMASSKEIPHSSRPTGQVRLTLSTKFGVPIHDNLIQEIILIQYREAPLYQAADNVAALVAAVREAGDNSLAMPISTRRSTMHKNASRSGPMGSLPSPPSSLPTHRSRSNAAVKTERGESAIDDDNNDEEMEDDEDDDFTKNRMRRASEGSQLLKDGKKANANDLKCDKCGKGYKHSSCLSKHLWEHTPEWSFTSKLLISKHQQVQLLEAAAVLVNMNQDAAANTPPDSAKDFQSDDQDSASPAASGSEDHDIDDRASSADTTPPPASMRHPYADGSYNYPKRYLGEIEYGRQSGIGFYPGSAPAGFGHARHQSRERRPPSSGMNGNKEDEGLTAAIELLSCGFASPGTPRSGLLIPQDAPLLPPRQRESFARESFTRGSYDPHQIHGDGDVQMEDGYDSVGDEDDYDRLSRGRSDEDDDGVFGRMEE
ncbi:hypothetical protein EYC84_007767 [Monilinia fructicola]|uniref:C2H2-type domain-containing protein n=1 Tax=Monilinia fructicola TaxID=38448 RepID=A0A5M9JLZ1_MONFR|nr:hypothetical protein EYC84_007767 [Monilinia fructicola]